MNKNILEEILTWKHVEIENARRQMPRAQLEALVSSMAPTQDFKAALKNENVSLIGEIKFKSPSKGVIADNLTVSQVVEFYRKAEVEAISILTDQKFFGGANRYLSETRKLIDCPLLRKDFIIDSYQLFEARTLGADAVLLIAGVLTYKELQELIALTEDLDMTALVECRSREEIDKALAAGASVIGINNRDLHTFEVDLQTTFKLMEEITEDNIIVVSESGIYDREQVVMLGQSGVDAILVGEALISAPNPGEKAVSLRNVPCRRQIRC